MRKMIYLRNLRNRRTMNMNRVNPKSPNMRSPPSERGLPRVQHPSTTKYIHAENL
jgi:hypothetical protein